MKRFFMVMTVSCVLAVFGCGSDSTDGSGQGSTGGSDAGTAGTGDAVDSGDAAGPDDADEGDATTTGDAGTAVPVDCGVCPEGTTCGLDPEYPALCVGDDCGEVEFAGACADEHTVTWCDEGTLYSSYCPVTVGEETVCAWDAEQEFYDCLEPPAEPEGVCLSDEDAEVIAAYDMRAQTTAAATECAAELVCTLDTLMTATGISEPCAGCYLDVVMCVLTNCYDLCIPEGTGDSVACGVCRTTYCVDDFYECSGLDAPACGVCPEGSACGFDLEIPEACVGESCGDVGAEAMCQDGLLTWCQDDALYSLACGAGLSCGYDEAAEAACMPPEPDDLCLNDADIAVLEQTDVSTLAGDAALACLGAGSDDVPGCVLEALTTDGGLSGECGGCYVGAVLCAGGNCMSECVPDASTPECAACQAEFCNDAFYLCSGFLPGCGNGICEVNETEEACAEDCAATSSCDMMCLGGCDDAAFQCDLDCTDSCNTACAGSDDQATCEAACADGTSEVLTTCKGDCEATKATCSVGCGCE